jgi:hypothetical protein
MKRLATTLLFATIFCLTTISVFAQSAIYLDANYRPATAENYTYKRVFKYKEPLMSPNPRTTFHGSTTFDPQPTGSHICTVTDYYKTGELALAGKVLSIDVGCSQQSVFDGKVVAYYKNGNIKREESWKVGKLHGTVITYDENERELKRELYENGNRIEEGKFAAPVDSPIIGTWKYVEYGTRESPRFNGSTIVVEKTPYEKRTATFIYSQNGVVESIHYNGFSTSTIKGNWKYIPRDTSSGILEEYQGEELIERGIVKWIGRNQIEYTITFSQNSDVIRNKYIWTRQ